MLKGLFVIVSIICFSWAASAQTVQAEFGKNRIQYHDDFDKWWMYETENFITYWYGKGRNVAHPVVQLAELDNDEIQSVLEHRFNDKIEIIVYTDLSDLKQSNLGSEEIFVSNTGQTKILGNKMFVYFDGDHQHLRDKIREGIAGVYLESMLYGSNLQEIVQNAVLLNLPDWYTEGLVSFLGKEWGSEIDNELRDVISVKPRKYYDFFRLAKEHPRLAGHSMWYFISKYYGKSTISNLLYLTRINRSLENGFLYVLGSPYEKIADDWSVFFKDRYEEEEGRLKPIDEQARIDIRNKRNIPFNNLKISPDGKTLAYVMNDRGKSRIYLHDLESNKRAEIFRTGIRNFIQETDYTYPLLAWDKSSQLFSFMYEKKDVLYLSQLNLETDELISQEMSPAFNRVYGFDYWTTDTLVLSASTDGFSDLYMYYPVTRASDRITEDYFDDLEISVTELQGEKGILFVSNRSSEDLIKLKLDSILPIENFDIYFMNWKPGKKSIRNLTNEPSENDRQPQKIGEDQIIFLTNSTGIWNRKVLTDLSADKPTKRFLSNYSRNILEHSATSTGHRFAEVARNQGWNRIYLQTLEDNMQVTPHNVKNIGENTGDVEENILITQEDQKEYEPDDKYLFQSRFKVPAEVLRTRELAKQKEMKKEEEVPEIDFLAPITQPFMSSSYKPSDLVEFRNVRAIAARLRFKLDYVNTTMDNNLLFGGLDSYAGTKREYETPPLGILVKANIKDLFEDYVFEGGARFPTSFDGSEYFVTFDNRKKKLDRRFALYRKVDIQSIENGLLSIERNQFVTVIGQYGVKYPLDVYTSVRATATLRNDRLIELVTDAQNLNAPIRNDQRIGLRVEYIYDNTLDIDVNIKNGTRYKAWIEVIKKFDLNLFEKGEGLTFNEGFMTVLGVDARHYVRLDRHSIFAARFTASTSLGSERILYYLGGVENGMFTSFDSNIPVPSTKNFAYQTLAAQMRGFQFNARNGSSVALVNTELRVPFLKYLSKRKIKSSFFRNLQVVGFADIGTAWHGESPFSKENPLNTIVLSNPPTVEVEVQYFRNPIVFGYGGGLRTLLFGYFIKLDYAWGWETNRVQSPMLHFSLGTDF